jgi:hydrogenase maturation protein HypF
MSKSPRTTHERMTGVRPQARERWCLDVRGHVQGVGFRPFVQRLATRFALAGSVHNAGAAVRIEAEGTPASLTAFVDALSREAPTRALRITQATLPPRGDARFVIRASDGADMRDLPPDVATCADCLRDLRDATNRRHRYAFTHCAACGPRWSVLENLPYDRERTTLRDFTPCAACAAEYRDPADRRFHAQGICCAACGPRLALSDAAGTPLARDEDALAAAVDALRAGHIVAFKATGGFQLWVRAADDAAVSRLRARKRRPHKPFALMVGTVAQAAGLCTLDAAEARELGGPAAPILLLARRADATVRIAASVAPGVPALGLMLPSSPLQTLLCEALGEPVVATSGNLAGEPICIDDTEARARLGDIADLFLGHDRRILRALDDTLARVVDGRLQVLRLGRGLAPLQLELPRALAPGLAVGGDLKSAIAVTTDTGLVLSQHLGDLALRDSQRQFGAALDDFTRLASATPRRWVRDLHPDYHSGALAPADAHAVPHHVAHAYACLAEHQPRLVTPFVAFTWDGSGYGPDGTLWGGECLRIDGQGGWARVASVRAFRLAGGESAVRDPRRIAVALADASGAALAPCAEYAIWRQQIARGFNAPTTSSIGRLFDGIAALIALHDGTYSPPSHEGQLALGLEALACASNEVAPYPLPLAVEDGLPRLDWRPLVRAVLTDLGRDRPRAAIARAFHAALVDGLRTTLRAVLPAGGARQVALGGGVFQNRVLLEAAIAALRTDDHEVFWSARIPINDGGLAAGQLLAACGGPQEH